MAEIIYEHELGGYKIEEEDDVYVYMYWSGEWDDWLCGFEDKNVLGLYRAIKKLKARMKRDGIEYVL